MTTPAESSPRLSVAGILRTGLWFGLITGFAEVLQLVVRKFVLGHLLNVSWHYFWMAPLADGALFLAGACGIALLALGLGGRLPSRVPLVLFLAVALACLLFAVPKLHPAALLVIALGVALRLSGGLDGGGFRRLVERTTVPLALLVVLLAAGGIGWRVIAERRALSSLGTPPGGAPNVLLIVLDTVRALELSAYGYERETSPALTRFAGRGVLFEQAFSTAPWTLPSHASMLTGRYPHELSADWLDPLDRRFPTLAERFAARGYATGGFVANVGYLSWEFGLDRGFSRYEDFLFRPRDIIATTAVGRLLDGSFFVRDLIKSDQHLVRVDAPSITGRFLHWVDGRAGRPFFAFLNYYDAHGPYLPPKSWDGHFGAPRSNDLSPIHRFMIHPGPKPRTLPAPVVQAERDQYDDAIGYLDAQLGQLFDSLQQRGMLDHTVVLLTADHGEEFGEHGVFDHGNSLYRPSVQVPLLVVYPPAVPAGRRVASPVTVRDVAATLSDLAGIAAPEAQGGLPGRSLARFWQSDSALGMQAVSPVLSEVSRGIRTAPWFPVSLGDMRSLVDSQYRYILGGDRTEQLFALGDVWETHSQVPDDSLLGAFRDRLQRMPWRH